MADEINLLTSFEFDKGGASLKRTAEQQKIDVSGDLYLETIASATSSGISVDKGDLATIGVARIKNLDATNYVRAGDDGTNYPLRINPGESFIMRLNGNALHLKSYVVAQVESFDVTGTGAVAQVETFTAVADVSDSLDAASRPVLRYRWFRPGSSHGRRNRNRGVLRGRPMGAKGAGEELPRRTNPRQRKNFRP